MKGQKKKLLLVDDEPFNLIILQEYLEADGYEVETTDDGESAWEILQIRGDEFSCVLLDRMMPGIDGIEVVKKMKAHPILKRIPVIMQTAAGTSTQVREGVAAGVFYYLIKPFTKELLLSLVHAALNQQQNYREDLKRIDAQRAAASCLQTATFQFRTIEEAQNIAHTVSSWLPDPSRTLSGITEMVINAVEHGNLSITYSEKTKLITDGTWQEEVKRRLDSPEYGAKKAVLGYERLENNVVITIVDEGNGFDFERYLEFDPKRLTDPHGRGIAMSKATAFDGVEYQDGGRKVVCVVNIADDKK